MWNSFKPFGALNLILEMIGNGQKIPKTSQEMKMTQSKMMQDGLKTV